MYVVYTTAGGGVDAENRTASQRRVVMSKWILSVMKSNRTSVGRSQLKSSLYHAMIITQGLIPGESCNDEQHSLW